MRHTKRFSILLIGLGIVISTWLSDIALSEMRHETWSNYTQVWETKWVLPNKQRRYEARVIENNALPDHKLLTRKKIRKHAR